MPLSNTQLKTFDADKLRLPADKRKTYHAQLDRLIDNLKARLKSTTAIKVMRVVKAGSFAKHTILRKTTEDPIDADLVFYVSGENLESRTLSEVNDDIHEALIGSYPTKQVEDFEIQRRAATVTFVGTGLSVDVVPVIYDPERPDYGWQYDLSDGSRIQTCAPCAIRFVRDRKAKDADFRTLVRLAKRWRNNAELKPLKSFTIELILAHLLDTEGAGGSIEHRFRRFLHYIAQSGLKMPISFPENDEGTPDFSDPVVILDPVCSTNNVASRITEDERTTIVAAALEAWETAAFASVEEDVDLWQEIFGRRFKLEEAA